MATLVFRPSRLTTIGPTLIIPDIILIVLIGDGAVIGDIIITVTTTIISMGVIIDQVIITKTTTMAINAAINVEAMVNTMETVIGRVTMDPACDDKLIARTGGQMGSENLKT
jgi:hypothetical protein